MRRRRAISVKGTPENQESMRTLMQAMRKRIAMEQPADNPHGIEHRYHVHRTDGRDRPGEKHDACFLWVLDLNHDPAALPAMDAYIAALPPGQLRTDLCNVLDNVRNEAKPS